MELSPAEIQRRLDDALDLHDRAERLRDTVLMDQAHRLVEGYEGMLRRL